MPSFIYRNLSFIIIGSCFISCDLDKNRSIDIIKYSDPFYATYAAATERSSFILDEGYEWHFYNPNKPIEFTTDTGGNLGVSWNINGKTVLLAKEMFQIPEISETYSDMVLYKFKPVADLEVEATFFVKSSKEALWELRLTNTGSESQNMSIKPYLKTLGRPFGKVKYSDEGIYFTHQEYPDGWTQGHKLPHQDSIRNLFSFSEVANQKAFTQWADEPAVYPYPISKASEMLRLQGRTYFQGNQRNLDPAPKTRIQAYKKGEPEILITENSAVPGMLLPVINQEGYYRLDLGLLGKINTTDIFQANYYHETQDLQHKTEVKLNSSGRLDRLDITLLEKNVIAIPKNIKLSKNDKTRTLTWDSEKLVHIYRRTYPDSKYYRVATSISGNSWTDVNTDVNYGYILTGTHPDGSPGMHSKEYTTIPTSSFLNADKTSILAKENVKVLAFETDFTLAPGASKTLRILRQVQAEKDSASNLKEIANLLLKENIEPYRNENKAWVKQLNLNQFKDKETQLLYLSAANMMKQQFYPPEGKSSHNYYVFSREPTWGWGHGGQVFHESLTMLAYAQIDPLMAMDSQRVYEERQYPNGYINYRTGSYLDEIINYKDTLTSSAPWYAWQNYEVYKITKDKDFLEKMYHSSVKFYNFFVSNRDYDQDGLAEWGGHAVLESVRDAAVAVWDEVAWPSNFDGVDVNSMLVMEAKALEQMARELGLDKEAEKWKADHMQRAHLINQYMWDEETGFYYNIDRRDNDFSYNKANDLKRMEIIGFLPLWAGICSDAQAAKLVAHLTDTSKFWRSYGVPSLSADDPFYNDKGYWNGPVWVEWNYLIFHGLKHYGYHKEADELTKRNAKALVEQLKINHNLWEFYSPDAPWAGYHKTYIWAGIINRMIKDSNLLKP